MSSHLPSSGGTGGKTVGSDLKKYALYAAAIVALVVITSYVQDNFRLNKWGAGQNGGTRTGSALPNHKQGNFLTPAAGADSKAAKGCEEFEHRNFCTVLCSELAFSGAKDEPTCAQRFFAAQESCKDTNEPDSMSCLRENFTLKELKGNSADSATAAKYSVAGYGEAAAGHKATLRTSYNLRNVPGYQPTRPSGQKQPPVKKAPPVKRQPVDVPPEDPELDNHDGTIKVEAEQVIEFKDKHHCKKWEKWLVSKRKCVPKKKPGESAASEAQRLYKVVRPKGLQGVFDGRKGSSDCAMVARIVSIGERPGTKGFDWGWLSRQYISCQKDPAPPPKKQSGLRKILNMVQREVRPVVKAYCVATFVGQLTGNGDNCIQQGIDAFKGGNKNAVRVQPAPGGGGVPVTGPGNVLTVPGDTQVGDIVPTSPNTGLPVVVPGTTPDYVMPAPTLAPIDMPNVLLPGPQQDTVP